MVRLDLVLPNEGGAALQTVRDAPLYEAMGYTGLWFTDHVIYYKTFPTFYGAYWLELLSTLSYVAATTSKVRLGLGVLVVPHRDAVLAAKMLATLDQLSGGRVDLGVGTGWAIDEFKGLGRVGLFEKRGAYTNEALDVFKLCWTKKGALAFEGQFTKFEGMEFEPKPVQAKIPLWIASSGVPVPNGPAMRRVARYADVWHPTGYEGQILLAAEVTAGKAIIDDLAGRAIPWSIRLHDVGSWAMPKIVDLLGIYRDAGCYQIAVDLGPHSAAGLHEKAESLAIACRDAGIVG
jgi:probable F420-dependent oxidoreductase